LPEQTSIFLIYLDSFLPSFDFIDGYVGNIHLQVTDAILQEVFQSIGPVEGCKLIRKEKTPTSRVTRRSSFSDGCCCVASSCWTEEKGGEKQLACRLLLRWSFILYGASRIHLLQKHHKSSFLLILAQA
ncbi:hypothetical protein ACJX0J_012668, partial [Zea mays]